MNYIRLGSRETVPLHFLLLWLLDKAGYPSGIKDLSPSDTPVGKDLSTTLDLTAGPCGGFDHRQCESKTDENDTQSEWPV